VIFSGRFILCRLNQFGLIQFEVRSGPRVLAQDKDQSRKRNRFSEEQIIGILKEHEAGVSVADLCRKHGVSDASIYKWKAKFGGLEVSEAKRLKTLEDENTRLKRLLADAMLDNAALKDLLGKKW
jgi:putative transposase